MEENLQSAEAIKDIRRMMDRSSRFISLSGLSGISAGICALIGAALAYGHIYGSKDFFIDQNAAFAQLLAKDWSVWLNIWIFWIGLGTFSGAFLSAFFFTWVKSRKQQIPLWGTASKRLFISVTVPMIAGGIFLLKMVYIGTPEAARLFAPGCLIFYGLALINASRHTLQEIKYLGYCQVLLGLFNLCFVGCGLYFWAAGFGVLHIVYGVYMWQKYDRKKENEDI